MYVYIYDLSLSFVQHAEISPMPAGMESFVPSRNSNKLLYCKAAPPFYLPRKFCACRIESDAAWMGTSASQMAGVQW